MMPDHLTVEVTADSLDEAVEQALAQLGCTRAEADVEVVQVHNSGLFGRFGKRPAQVLAQPHDRGAIARYVARRLLRLSDLEAEVELVATAQQIELVLTTTDSSQLIGRHGQTLDAIQGLVKTMTDRLTTDRTPIQLEVDGYRQRRTEFLNRLARRMSRRVHQSGRPATTPPLNLNERRILHDLFKQEPGLESRSKEHQGDRKVIVLQKRG